MSRYYNKEWGDPVPENEIELDWHKEYMMLEKYIKMSAMGRTILDGYARWRRENDPT